MTPKPKYIHSEKVALYWYIHTVETQIDTVKDLASTGDPLFVELFVTLCDKRDAGYERLRVLDGSTVSTVVKP